MSLRTSIYLDFKSQGANDVKRAIGGIVSETRRAAADARRADAEAKASARARSAAEKQAAKASLMAQRAAKKEADRLERASSKTAQEAAKQRLAAQKQALKAESEAAKAVERVKRDEAKRTSQEARRLAQAEARWRAGIIRDQRRDMARGQRQAQQQQRQIQQRAAQQATGDRQVMGNIGMGIMGVGTALAGAGMAYGQENYTRSRQWIGLEDEDALVSKWGQTHLQIMNTADQSRGERSTAQLERLALRGAEGYGVSPDVTSSMFANIQDMYSDQAGAIVEHFERINEISAAYQADLSGVSESGAIVMRDLGVTQDQMDEALQSMAGSTGSGSVNMSDLSSQFGAVPNLLRATFGDNATGMQGVQQFSALAQISGRSGVQGDERATTLMRFLQELKDPETAKRLRDATHGRVNIRDRNGAMLPTRDVLQALMSPEMDRPGVTEDVFQSIPAQTFLRGLRTGGIGTYDQLLAESNPEAGAEMISMRMRNLQNDPAYQARLDVGRQAATVYRQAPRLVERARNQTGYISEWESANVGMSGALRTPLTVAAAGAEGLGSILDSMVGDGSAGSWTRMMQAGQTEEDRGTFGAKFGDTLADPRLLFRNLLGGNAGALSGNFANGAAPQIGESGVQQSMDSLVQDIIRQAGGVPGAPGAAPGQNSLRGDVTDPLVRATQEQTTRLEGAIGRISLTAPGAPTGSTTGPTPTPSRTP